MVSVNTRSPTQHVKTECAQSELRRELACASDYII